jgi:hypothetical protein
MPDTKTSSKTKKSTRNPKRKSVSTEQSKSVKPIRSTVKKGSKETASIKRDARYKKISALVQKIPRSVVPKFKIYWVNTIRNSISGPYNVHIYRILVNDKSAYFYVPITAKYAYITFYNIPFIFKVDPEAKSLSSAELTEISKYHKPGIDESAIVEKNKTINRNKLFNSLKIATLPVFQFDDYLDFSGTKRKLEELNGALQNKCPNLSLHLDYVYNMDFPNNTVRSFNNIPHLGDPLLCLYNDDGCISSITLDNTMIYNSNEQKYDTIYISSKTDKLYENKKYNKLLRSVAILLSNLISPDITRVFSYTINPVSTYILMKYLGGVIATDEEYNNGFFAWLKTTDIELGPSTYRRAFEEYFEYTKNTKEMNEDEYNDRYQVVILVYITKENIQKAQHMFETTLKELSCN